MPPLPPSPFDGAIDRRKRDASLFRVLRGLLPYVWPSQRPDLRRRIYLAFALMIAAKLITVCGLLFPFLSVSTTVTIIPAISPMTSAHRNGFVSFWDFITPYFATVFLQRCTYPRTY